ncbi:hypothetical protein CAL19_14935 [Bordetella genomosp. 7]|uniref:Lipoprotein SmpA/OmlA domain-containing protein n=2 Tax=Alcaligenaceae TaxID=506 RepID=A0A261QWG4_9BORD|nr:hypothetical protein CAL19_14935 [Bordetella genomosp. 7]
MSATRFHGVNMLGLKRILLLSTFLLLSACAGTGGIGGQDRMSPEYLRQHLAKGKTTKADVQQMFGTPRYKTDDSDGSSYWSYSERQINGNLFTQAMEYLPSLGYAADTAIDVGQGPKTRRSLDIWFDTRGRLSSYNVGGSTGVDR